MKSKVYRGKRMLSAVLAMMMGTAALLSGCGGRQRARPREAERILRKGPCPGAGGTDRFRTGSGHACRD